MLINNKGRISVRIFLPIVLLFFSFVPVLAEPNEQTNFPAHSEGPLRFDVDVSQFEARGDSTRVEIMYAVDFTGGDSTQKQTILSIRISINSESGQQLLEIRENKTILLYDPENSANDVTFLDLKQVVLLPGNVTLQLTMSDSVSKRSGAMERTFSVREFPDTFSISDLCFISHVQKTSGTSIFEKHGVMLIPHPSRLFRVDNRTQKAFVFYEINNLTYDAERPTYYDVHPVVYDISGREVFRNSKEIIKVNALDASRIEVLPIGDFSSGLHRLIVDIIDRSSGIKRKISGHFQIVKNDSGDTDILPMSAKEEAKYLDQIKYIASDLEKDIFSKLNSRGKQEFLLRFWRSKDTDPSTPENEFMIEHFRRIAVVEQEFRGGINSDMGRIYIMYGPPVDIERQSLQVGSSQAVEIWYYAVDGRTEFIFVDRDGDRRFVLVHSTHKDEYINPGWREELK